MRLIDADRLSNKLTTWLFSDDRDDLQETTIKFFLISRWIEEAETVPPNFIIRGWWKEQDDRVICSNCGEFWGADEFWGLGIGGFGLPNYCPNCGAKMDALKEADDD